MMRRLNRFKVVVVTDRTDLQEQLGQTAQLSGEAVRPNRRRLEDARIAHGTDTTNTERETPDIVLAMLQKYQVVGSAATGRAVEILPESGSKPRDKVAMTIVRKEKKPGKDETVTEKQVTFEESIHFEEFPVLNESEEILVLVDEAHRSHTRTLHRNLRKALPNAAISASPARPFSARRKLRPGKFSASSSTNTYFRMRNWMARRCRSSTKVERQMGL